MKIQIKNWDEFQHFKDRTPPWIKLYKYLLDDPDWHALDGDTAKTLIMLWLIASEDKTMTGTLPDNKKLAFRLRISESKLNQSLIKLSDWLIFDDNNLISGCYQDDAPEERQRRDRGDSRITKTVIPDNFLISDNVKQWAKDKGFNNLDRHLEHFINTAKAKGYKYVDWDRAFMNAISSNWAKIDNKQSSDETIPEWKRGLL